MMSAENLEKAKLVQMGLQQFDSRHIPLISDGQIYCKECNDDYPCERMLLFMLLQSIATLSAMVPSGNMANVMARFMGGNNNK